jgi:hypothetical protein
VNGSPQLLIIQHDKEEGMNRGKCSFGERFGWFFVLVLLSLAVPLTANSFVKGDINGDDQIGLPESVYALETTAGLRTFDVVKTLNVPADFDTIQAAVDAASEGDTIKVAAGTFSETVSITKDYITLEGAGEGNTIIDAGTQDAVTIDSASNVTVKGFTIQNGRYGIFVRKGSLTNLENTTVQNNSSDGVRIDENSNSRITDCRVLQNGSNGIRLFRNSTATLLGAVVANENGDDGIDLNSTSNIFLYQSTVTASDNSGRGIQITGSSSFIAFNGVSINTLRNGKDGVGVFSVSRLAIDQDGSLESESNAGRGLHISGTSRSFVGNGSQVSTKGNNDDGILVFAASSLTVENNGKLVSENNQDSGITIAGSSSFFVDNTSASSTTNNIGNGLVVADASTSEIKGGILSENDGSIGLAVARSSSVFIENEGSFTARSIKGDGQGIYIAETSSVRVRGNVLIENNEGDYCAGIFVARQSSLRLSGSNLSVEILNNKGFGIWAVHQSTVWIGPGVKIHNNTNDGLNIYLNCELFADNLFVQDNGGRGITANDGSIVRCNNSTITGNAGGDVNLEFGSRSSLDGNTIGSLPISCDNTVLSRGNHVCP